VCDRFNFVQPPTASFVLNRTHVSDSIKPILLSPPDVGIEERDAILRAFDSGWIAPAGAELDAFEDELAIYTGARACVALSSGTAALHLALLAAGVKPGDEVVVQSATFAASAFAVAHAGAVPVFMDSDWATWCLDAGLLNDFFEKRATQDRLPAAVMPVDLYGSCADYERISKVCEKYGVPLVRDAAESLGSRSTTGRVGDLKTPAVVSFNGNKIITASSGGALLADPVTVDRARYLATQARQPSMHYEHTDIGFNYRLSNLLAALGRAQLAGIEAKIERRTEIHNAYRAAFPELEFCTYGATPRPNHWLTVVLIDEGDPIGICEQLHSAGVQARPAWKPMHMQPVFGQNEYISGDGVASALFGRGICLPSGSVLSDHEVGRVIKEVRSQVLGAR